MKTTPVMPFGLDRCVFTQAHVHLNSARIGAVKRQRFDRPDIDTVELDRIAERESADRFVEMDAIEDVVTMARGLQPHEK
jgi:hypothetical protein